MSTAQIIAIPNSFGSAQHRLYYPFMPPTPRRRTHPAWRLVVEVAFIIFLFYSNLLMGEFNRSAGKGKSLAFALHDIFTGTNLVIALVSASIGWVVIEFLRKKL